MISSLYSGTTGMQANSVAMGVVGSNIANVNTIGFKTGTASFANILSQNLSDGGVEVWGMNQSWAQGSLQHTGNATDMAVVGKGLFMVTDETGQTYYTRAGAFNFDRNGNLVNNDGLRLQGYRLGPGGQLGAIGDINIAGLSSPPSATSEMFMDFNLSGEVAAATATIEGSEPYSGVTYTAASPGEEGNKISVRYIDSGEGGLAVSVSGTAITVDLGGATPTASEVADAVNNDPDAGDLVEATAVGNGTGQVETCDAAFLSGGAEPSDFTAAMTVYDSLGNPVNLSIDFTYDAEGCQWNWIARSSAGTPGGYGIIKFDESGHLDMANSKWDTGTPQDDPPAPSKTIEEDGNPEITIENLTSGAADMTIEWDMTDDSVITGYAAPSAISSQNQNGYASGDLIDVKLTNKGIITGVFSNGKTEDIYQVGLAGFSNYQGLMAIGDNLYKETVNSGEPIFGAPDTGGRGSINSGALEMSNVDLADEFVKMITIQRAYQANSKVIVTSDQLLQDLINLKR